MASALDNRLPCRALARASGLALLLQLAVAVAADANEPGNLDEVIALATRAEQASPGNPFDAERCSALERLAKWAPVSSQEEARIAEAFTQSLAGSSNIRNAAARGLGQRAHDEVLPMIFEIGERDPNVISGFAAMRTLRGEAQAPIELLKRGLHSRNPGTRQAVLEAARSYKASGLREQIEAALASDPSTGVQEVAAKTIVALDLWESLPVLRKVFAGGRQTADVAYALTRLGTEEDIVAVLPLLKRADWGLRETICGGLAQARVAKPRRVCDALLPLLTDESESVRRAAMKALAHFRDSRALPLILKALTDPQSRIASDQEQDYVNAVAEFDREGAVAVLNAMAQREMAKGHGIEEVLIRFGSPSSGWAMWKMYLKDPVHVNYDSDVLGGGYRDALLVVAACADETLLRQVEARLSKAKDPFERGDLRQVVERIKKRLGR